MDGKHCKLEQMTVFKRAANSTPAKMGLLLR